MKILCIGNSFSHDACRYLHDMAAAGGYDVTTVNLFIGGCPLKKHSENLTTNAAEYDYELNGFTGSRKISIKDALLSDKWDIVTVQQASGDSGDYSTYYPYLATVLQAVRALAPKAKIYIHQTWSYEQDSDHGDFVRYNCSQQTMYKAIVRSYKAAAEREGLPILRSGEAVQYVRSLPQFDYANGGQSLCRDGYHMHLIYGRYLLAAVWYETLLGESVLNNDFLPPDVDDEQKAKLEIIKQAVHRMKRAKP